ncbi:MAG: sulfide/dihydroorotate dehydrogenase-like FAD/NAD-binding protein [Candidatus Omnitrophota bacterium]
MFEIVEKSQLGEGIKKMVIRAPDIAARACPGQFVILRIDDKGERIPLTISAAEGKKGLITLIFQEVGFSTAKLGGLSAGEKIRDVLGPLGRPTEIKRYGAVVCVGGGVGVAELLPVAQGLADAGNTVIGIIGARNKQAVILSEELKAICHCLHITTDDGSQGKKGLVTDALKDIISARKIDLVYAIGPVAMMSAVCDLTLKDNIKTKVSLNPIMVDGTGMCGSCRVNVGGEIKFCCLDGPDFDGHKVDFKELGQRVKLFNEQERSVCKGQ